MSKKVEIQSSHTILWSSVKHIFEVSIQTTFVENLEPDYSDNRPQCKEETHEKIVLLHSLIQCCELEK